MRLRVLYSFFGSAGLAAFVWFCVVLDWSGLGSLRLCGSVNMYMSGLAAFVCSVWFSARFGRSRCVCLVLYGCGLVSAGLAAFVSGGRVN